MKGELLYERCGTPAYIAPEIIREVPYEGTLVDVWSAGVVLYTMICGEFPFNSDTIEELEQSILLGKYTLPTDISEHAHNLLIRMLCPNPSLRISIAEIYQHPWIQDVDPLRIIIA
jgi:serine/threonine protein kinase